MIGIIVCMLISLLIIEDHLTSIFIQQKNVRIMMNKLELAAKKIVKCLIQLLKDYITLINTRLIYASSLERKEKLAKKVNCVLLCIFKLK